MEFNAVKDSGERSEYSTGAVRDARGGKGRFDLIPPYALYRLARHFENGAVKYGDRNWEKGIPLHMYLDSAFRHLVKYMAGFRDEDHLTAAVWNLMCLIETEKRVESGTLPKELNDIYKAYPHDAEAPTAF